MGKMIDAQSIVVAGVATGQQGNEGEILRYVFWHCGRARLPDGRAGVPAVHPALLDDPRVAALVARTRTRWIPGSLRLLALDVSSRPGRLSATEAEQLRWSIELLIHCGDLGCLGGDDVERYSRATAGWSARGVRGARSSGGGCAGGSEPGTCPARRGGNRQDRAVGIPAGTRGRLSHRASGGGRIRDGTPVRRAASALRTRPASSGASAGPARRGARRGVRAARGGRSGSLPGRPGRPEPSVRRRRGVPPGVPGGRCPVARPGLGAGARAS